MSINPILVPLKLFGHDTVYLLQKLCYDMKIVYMLCYMSTSVKYGVEVRLLFLEGLCCASLFMFIGVHLEVPQE